MVIPMNESSSEELPTESDTEMKGSITTSGGPEEPPAMPEQPPAGLPLLVGDDRDTEHLKILSICYYVDAGLVALFACFPILHLIMGAVMIGGGFGSSSMPTHEREMMQWMGALTMGMSSLFILLGWLLAVMNFIVARKIVKRESRVFCLIVAGVNCMNMPLGTVLGVFTFILLSRPQVVQSFEQNRKLG